MRALAAMLTGIAPLRIFLVLALSGTSIAKTTDATASADELDREMNFVPPEAELVAALAVPRGRVAHKPPVSADCARKRDIVGSDVVLLMGQSNMSGRGQPYDRALDGPNNPRIKQWSRANTIITAEEHLQHHDSHSGMDKNVGMGLAFGRAYVETLPEQRDVLLVPTAHGGTALVNGPWSPGGFLFEDAVTRMKAALVSNEADGNCVAAVLWHQGEADADHHVAQDAYVSAWVDMIGELRSRIPAAAEAPVVLGEFAEPWVESNPDAVEPILEAIRAIPDSVAFSAVADARHLSVNPGQTVHFDAVGQREFGERYFDTLKDAIRNDDATSEARLDGGEDDAATATFAAVAA
eukprot:g9053.t1